MTLLQLRTLTLDWLDDASAGYFTTSTVNLRLNLALRELQKRLISANEEFYSQCSKTNLVVGQNAYALPSDFMQVIRLEYVASGSGATANVQKIFYMSPNQRDLISDTSGDPGYYFFQKNNIILVPTPNAIREMHLEYSYQVADMASDSDIPDAPSEYHEYIAILATRDCLIKDGRSIAPIESKLAQYEKLLKEVSEQRMADGARMVVQTSNDFY